jgi:hypothetical protein
MQHEKTLKRTKAPSLVTYRKIQELAAYREQYIKEKGKPPLLTHACQKTGIGYRTIKRNAPQLIERWKEEDFHW